MVDAFVYLTACSMKNRLRRRLQRLREPRYLAGLVAGLLYMYFVVFRRSGRPRPSTAGLPAIAAISGPMQFLGSLFLLAIAAVAWVVPGVGQPLAFSRSEVQFLFPAPVTRRELVHFKILRSQVGILMGSAIATLLLRPGSLASGWTLMAGLWMMLMAVRLHLMGVALRRASLAEHGASGLARQWLPLGVVLGALGVLAAAVVGDWQTLASLRGAGDVFTELQRLGSRGAAGAVLWPFRAFARLPLSASAAEFVSALPAALGLLALNYVWVLRSDAAFEEASADHAEKRATARRAPRAVVRGTASTPFTLAAEGPPETAILWKNLILVGRYVSLRTLLRLLPVIVIFGIIAQGQGGRGIASFLAAICLPLAAFVVLLGPQMMRNDLRQDLGNLALLKTWPVRGAALIRGEVLAPTVVVSVAAWLFILLGAILAPRPAFSGGTTAVLMANRASFAIAAAILAPAIILSQTVVQNALAVLFPAWVPVGAARSRGIDAMGQRLLMLAGILLTLAASLLPGALIAGVVAIVVYWATGVTLIILPAIILALVVVGECWLAVEGLGRVLERTDVGAIDAAE
jgi:ABC-2 type transport system permease protein